ncbi:MAG: MFS transporter [Candidatus Competibacteraceae bacterium]|nr:MFS transporter [Candidatus Competibacteraceae bacterium]
MTSTRLYFQLSSFYWFYFATLGVLLPYWGLYLEALGLPPARIGELMAITLATKIVAPNLWGWLADHTGRRITIVRLACLLAMLSFIGVYGVGNSYIGLALVMLIFSFFWNAALPQFEAITLNHLGDDTHRYSSIRLWGSLGFIALALLGGFLAQRWGIAIIPTLLLVLFAALWLSSLAAPGKEAAHVHSKLPSFRQVLRQPLVVVLLLVCFLNQASHGPYYAFFSIYLEQLGYQTSTIGLLWDLGVAAEVGIFMLMPWLLPRLGARRLLMISLASASLRWVLIGYFATYLPLLMFAQTLHALSFGVYHAVAIHWIHQLFTGHHQGRGQALYSSISFGAGGAIGSLVAGYLWADWGAGGTYTLAAAVSALGWVLAWRGLQSAERSY